jgi:hypothetical protein
MPEPIMFPTTREVQASRPRPPFAAGPFRTSPFVEFPSSPIGSPLRKPITLCRTRRREQPRGPPEQFLVPGAGRPYNSGLF